IGHQEYGWQFVGSDVNPVAVATCDTIIKSNACLKGAISTRLQSQPKNLFGGIWEEKERFDLTLCNPPFHTSESAMLDESQRKWRGVKGKTNEKKPTLNFGGTAPELWCDGGEAGFITRMVKESVQYGDRCVWFTSLVARQGNLETIYRTLKQAGARQVKTIEMAQGQKISRFVAWSFLENDQIDYWKDNYWQS
ncbi:MAG: RlmF-related methyltransferase, partial [Hyphomicrobiales bacterium]